MEIILCLETDYGNDMEIILCHDFQFTPLISVTFYGNDTMP